MEIPSVGFLCGMSEVYTSAQLHLLSGITSYMMPGLHVLTDENRACWRARPPCIFQLDFHLKYLLEECVFFRSMEEQNSVNFQKCISVRDFKLTAQSILVLLFFLNVFSQCPLQRYFNKKWTVPCTNGQNSSYIFSLPFFPPSFHPSLLPFWFLLLSFFLSLTLFFSFLNSLDCKRKIISLLCPVPVQQVFSVVKTLTFLCSSPVTVEWRVHFVFSYPTVLTGFSDTVSVRLISHTPALQSCQIARMPQARSGSPSPSPVLCMTLPSTTGNSSQPPPLHWPQGASLLRDRLTTSEAFFNVLSPVLPQHIWEPSESSYHSVCVWINCIFCLSVSPTIKC